MIKFIPFMKLSEAIISFLEYYTLHNYSRKTLETYASILRRWMNFNNDCKLSDLKLEDLNHFRLAWLRNGLKNATVNQALAAIRAFAAFLEKKEISFINPRHISLGKKENRIITILTPDEVQKILSVVDSARDRAIIQLLLTSGVRVAELVSLNIADLDLGIRQFSVIGKGRKPRTCFMNFEAAGIIKEWLKTRTDHFPALFTSLSTHCKEDGRLTTVAVQQMIKRYADKAGIRKRVTPHVFRHTWATFLLSHGCDLKSLQEMMGHSSMNTTQVYLHLVPSQLKIAYERCFSN